MNNVQQWNFMVALFVEREGQQVPKVVDDVLNRRIPLAIPSLLAGIKPAGTILQRFHLKEDGSYRDANRLTFEEWLVGDSGIELRIDPNR